jgi:hypothetical protein
LEVTGSLRKQIYMCSFYSLFLVFPICIFPMIWIFNILMFKFIDETIVSCVNFILYYWFEFYLVFCLSFLCSLVIFFKHIWIELYVHALYLMIITKLYFKTNFLELPRIPNLLSIEWSGVWSSKLTWTQMIEHIIISIFNSIVARIKGIDINLYKISKLTMCKT